MQRRSLLLATASLAATAPRARAQTAEWPNRPVRLIVPFPPGGPSDIFARLLAPLYSAALHQPVVVENRAGGGGVTGTDAAAKATPDGYVLAITNGGSLVISPHVSGNVPYRVPEDFTLLSVVSRVPEALVAHPRLGLRTLPELVARAKREPGKLNIGTAGAAGISHLAAELLRVQAGVEIVVVPYRGAAPAVTDLVAGNIDLLFADLPVLLPQLRGGAMVALAMASGQRSPSLPEVSTTGEAGYPDLLADNWYAVVGPARLPEPVVARLSAVLRQASQDPALRAAFQAQGAEAVFTTPAEFTALVARESEKWRRIAESAGIRTD
ncbi:tripartite tricarboxylate transporter substrate binding protein [Siccirubricoccus sp. G192]|uniref:Bug family tripartite tricarboxylate transporter substrate binding protein n=1 Tax=Siccirubricoccus sp. G192 TaxID=2849651 RepID=UPI001C2C63DC|nr:tripartite tricarboxylate transporter substrate binding protein [Siccirubricoccus sp. G192]MBV1798564.1 tripartite tricarboxylate transporter substrate binding protein [Siccirubricoccus sp. G192]